jgi:TP53 regulating kinase-like protein
LCLKIGKLVGKLHAHGIIHGDLTTSNMIRNSEGKIFFVDFGLGERTKELEPRGVDLHLLKRALQSIHFNFTDECFDAVIAGYTEILDREEAIDILNKISEIERRGRYVAERKMEQEW